MTKVRVMPSLFFLVVLFCLLGCPLYASAQSTAAGESLNSTDVAGSGDNLSTYSGSSSLNKFGIDDTQPQRTDDQGNTVDKNNNPFGTTNKTVVANSSLAEAGIGGGNFTVNDVGGSSTVMTDSSSADWAKMPKVMTAANIKGSAGYQQVLNAVLVPVSGTTYNLELVIEDYNGGGKANTPTKCIVQLARGISMPAVYFNTPKSEIYKSHFRIVACAGRVAILVNRTLYDYQLTYYGSSYSAALLRSTTFDGSNALAPIANSDTPMIDLKSGDPNHDGLQELVLAVSSVEGTNQGRLLIYKWENSTDVDFRKPMYSLNPCENVQSQIMKSLCVTVGNIAGSGDSILVGGYIKNFDEWAYKYVSYDSAKGFTTSRGGCEQIKYSSDTNVKNKALPVLTCVSLDAPAAGEAPYVFYDGFVLQFSTSGNQNLQCNLTYSTLPIKEDEHPFAQLEAIYSDTAVGNLLSSTYGKPGVQQLWVLWQDTTYGTYGYRLYYMSSNKIISQLSQNPGAGINTSYNFPTRFPALTGAIIKDQIFSLKFSSASFAMSDPKVVAVLGASPYYKEFKDEYGNGWNCESTRYGTSETKGQEISNSLTIKAGASIGVDFEISAGLVVQEKIAEFEGEINVSDEFTAEWSSAKSVTVGKSFSSVADDMVVVSSIPYDLYQYQICDPGQPDDGKMSILKVPYEPRLSLMSLSDYNDAVAAINNEKDAVIADTVPDSVLMHTVGDPRTYQSSINFSAQDVSKDSVITGGEFLGVGTGNGLSEQTISTETESSSAFNNAINVDISFKATVGTFMAGFSRGVGWDCGVTISNGSATEISGSVVNLPPAKNNYDFTWELVGYQAKLSSGFCPVVNYLVKTAQVPPPAPEDVQLLSYNGTTAVIAWDAINDANLKQFLVYRSTSKNIDKAIQPYASVTTITPTGQIKYSDTRLQQGQQYYYEIIAEDSYQGALIDSLPSDILAVPALITGLAIKSQPQLQYNDGDTLDLSGLVLTAAMSNGSSKDLTLSDLKKRGVSFSIQGGTILSLDDSGVPIYIIDPMTQLLVVTDPLTVTKNSINSSISSITFTVGSTDNASWLAAGQKLTAHIGITNKQSSPQAVIAIVALFDPNGTMCADNYATQTIASGASKTIDVGGFTLPSSIGGYTAKAFLVEGSEFDTSSLRPLSSIGQIGAQSSGSGNSSGTKESQGNVVNSLNP